MDEHLEQLTILQAYAKSTVAQVLEQKKIIKQQKNEILEKDKIIEQQKDEITEQAKKIEQQKDEITEQQGAYARRLGRALVQRDDKKHLTMPYASCVRRILNQSAKIKTLNYIVEELTQHVETLTMMLDALASSSAERTASDMKHLNNKTKNEAIVQYYAKTIAEQQKKIDTLMDNDTDRSYIYKP